MIYNGARRAIAATTHESARRTQITAFTRSVVETLLETVAQDGASTA